MKFSILTAALAFSYATLTSGLPAESPETPALAEDIHHNTPKITPEAIASAFSNTADSEELVVNVLVEGLKKYMQEFEQNDEGVVLSERSNLPILDLINAALKETNLANIVFDTVLLSPRLLELTADGLDFLLKNNFVNLTNVLIATEKSGLIPQVIELTIKDPNVLPGLLRIGTELFRQFTSTPASKRSIEELSEIFDSEAVRDLIKRDNPLLNDIFASLADSGLGISVIQHLFTDPQLAAPIATFLIRILRSHAITLPELLNAVRNSHFVRDIINSILGDSSLLENFGKLISNLLSSGL
ncbi:uncharacterized protein PRCAT00002860001 [Priceomyces carsonii]|uniref:uncharacterized protein n=1 Tax=Priceomyces carsonii TaxID=28549 RepID=UPI002ED8C4BA|nr:unnamed protein product [Priceomyces carsonii]